MQEEEKEEGSCISPARQVPPEGKGLPIPINIYHPNVNWLIEDAICNAFCVLGNTALHALRNVHLDPKRPPLSLVFTGRATQPVITFNSYKIYNNIFCGRVVSVEAQDFIFHIILTVKLFYKLEKYERFGWLISNEWKTLWSCIMGNGGSSIFGPWLMLGTIKIRIFQPRATSVLTSFSLYLSFVSTPTPKYI